MFYCKSPVPLIFTSFIWIPALRKRFCKALCALVFASSRMFPLKASWIIISPAFSLSLFSISMSFCVTIPSFVVCVAPVSSTQKILGAPRVMVTVPSRETSTFPVVIFSSVYPALTTHVTVNIILSLNNALVTMSSTVISGTREMICCSHSIVLVNDFCTVSNFPVVVSSVMIEAVVCLMTVAHLYCNQARKPYTHTKTIHTATRYFIERFMKNI